MKLTAIADHPPTIPFKGTHMERTRTGCFALIGKLACLTLIFGGGFWAGRAYTFEEAHTKGLANRTEQHTPWDGVVYYTYSWK